MTWDGNGFGSHAETSIEQPATTWYLAEGSTAGTSTSTTCCRTRTPAPAAGDDHASSVRAAVRSTKSYTVDPRSRRTINIDNETGFAGRPATERTLQSTDVSATDRSTNGVPILVERAMYMTVNGRVFAAGHDSAGVTAPQTSWFLAEGATGTFFDLFILLANPTTTPTTVRDHLPAVGRHAGRARSTACRRRAAAPSTSTAEPGLANVATSAIVRSLNAAVPIVVERAMWWPDGNWTEAHNSAGADRHVADLGAGRRRSRRHVRQPDLSSWSPTRRRSPRTVRVTAYFEDQGSPLDRRLQHPGQQPLQRRLQQHHRPGPPLLGPRRRHSGRRRARYRSWSSSGRCTRTRAARSGRPAPTRSARRSSRPNTFTVTPNGLFPKVLVVDDGTRVTIVNRDPDSDRHHRLRAGRPRHLRRSAPDARRQPGVRQRPSRRSNQSRADAEPRDAGRLRRPRPLPRLRTTRF